MAIEAVLGRHREELAAEGVEVTPQLVQLLLRLVKEVREKKAMVSQHLDGRAQLLFRISSGLGLTEEDLLAYALVLGRKQPEHLAFAWGGPRGSRRARDCVQGTRFLQAVSAERAARPERPP
jgi:hypothetical protein